MTATSSRLAVLGVVRQAVQGFQPLLFLPQQHPYLIGEGRKGCQVMGPDAAHTAGGHHQYPGDLALPVQRPHDGNGGQGLAAAHLETAVRNPADGLLGKLDQRHVGGPYLVTEEFGPHRVGRQGDRLGGSALGVQLAGDAGQPPPFGLDGVRQRENLCQYLQQVERDGGGVGTRGPVPPAASRSF